jgi:hypothetical protein
MDIRERSIITSDDIIMESLHEMAASHSGRERVNFVEVAMEAISNPSQQHNLLNKLFKDLQKVESIDFGKISDSKGDLTKYHYYQQLYDCIELMNKLCDERPTPNITTLNKLHDILLGARADFVFGYRTENYVIINTYRLMTISLYEMINICAVDCTEYLRAKLSMSLTEPTTKKVRVVTKTANNFIKMYEKGQWNILMKAFRKDATAAANEAITIQVDDNGVPGGQVLANVGNRIMDLPKKFPTLTKVVGALLALIALLIALRKAVYYFFHARNKLSNNLKTNAEILKTSINNDLNDGSAKETSIERQKKMLKTLEHYADVLDYNINKTEADTEKAIKDSDRENFNSNELTKISGSDFEI